ncbi:MAG: hypothetical protein Q8868_02215, partial [Bacteroidota bacterium]|nr:hypothetical protein [Bacteroidota bacterium]
MKHKIICSLALALAAGTLLAGIKPVKLTCEYLDNPPVIDVRHPRLSWINIADRNERGQVQTAFEIRVAGKREDLLSGKCDLWNSGKVLSDVSLNIPYDGKPLASRQDCWWQVRVWDRKGKVSEWSEPGYWSMGILDSGEWKASWIGAPW